MGFTGVVWGARSTEQLARDLTTGPGPGTMGEAGASWVKVANAYAGAAEEFKKLVDQLRTSWESQGGEAVVNRIESFGEWLAATSLNAAANGQRAEEVAVANTVAVLAMPSVSAAVEAKASHDMMASLAAYNGAVLTGTFAELDANLTANQENAAAVMEQYEMAAEPLAVAWEEPLPPDVVKGDALKAEKDAKDAKAKEGKGGGGGGAGGAPRQLGQFTGQPVKGSEASKGLQQVRFSSSGGGTGMGGGMGGGMGAMGAMGARGAGSEGREHESTREASPLEGGGEASESGTPGAWLPAAQQNDAPFMVSNVSWGPTSAVFDELAVPAEQSVGTEDEANGPLEQISDRWVSRPVIGGERETF